MLLEAVLPWLQLAAHLQHMHVVQRLHCPNTLSSLLRFPPWPGRWALQVPARPKPSCSSVQDTFLPPITLTHLHMETHANACIEVQNL